MTPAFDSIAPHPEGVDADDELIHERAYVVRAYHRSPDTLVLRGGVRDQKPPGAYIVGDTEPLTVHHMVVDLTVSIPALQITAAHAALEIHPHTSCPRIEDHYANLIGLSITRGFTHRVRELFGGPRGCTHTTALLQAMAPVAIQSMWSFRLTAARESGAQSPFDHEDGLEGVLATNINTCHVWAEDGAHVAEIRSGQPMEVPLWITKRFAELDRDPNTWRS